MARSKFCNCKGEMVQLTAKCKIFLLLMLLLLRSAVAQLDIPTYFQSSKCEGSEYANGSALERNLKVVLNLLIQDVGERGYNISWYGENGDKIYGLVQCRGDLNASTCRACASEAKEALGKRCEGYSFGSIRLNGCFLRYATDNFYSKLLYTTLTTVECENIPDRTDLKSRGLDSSIASLLTLLVENAVSSNVSFSTVIGHGIYGLAQCWRDLSMDNCRKCLNTGYQYFLDCPQQSGEGQGFNENCMIRYERYNFYRDAGLLSSPTSRATEGERGPNLPLILGLTLGCVVIVLLLGLAVIWKRKVSNPRSLGYSQPSTELSTIISA